MTVKARVTSLEKYRKLGPKHVIFQFAHEGESREQALRRHCAERCLREPPPGNRIKWVVFAYDDEPAGIV